MEVTHWNGWDCARLTSGDLEALITLDVGPRIVKLSRAGGPNLLHESAEQRGLKGGDGYRSYGGHRLWIAPESKEVTYFPENEPVEVLEEGGWLSLRSAADPHGLQRELRIRPADGEGFELEQRIHNLGEIGFELAPWALTVMAPGGECIFPQEPFEAHSENFLPVRPLVLWSYTEMSDPRWTWGRRLVRLRHDPDRGPQKVGAFVRQGWAAYALGDDLFMKRFGAVDGGRYPDYGCNFETFTRHDMLEVESLGLLETVASGDYASLRETWTVVGSAEMPDEEEAAEGFLQSIADGMEF
ncbi:MAG: hypothetical protein IT363_10485 [Methanoregulaceae archaeon]|nr:hypothetical protein [Methanoregulaceae archaeon]